MGAARPVAQEADKMRWRLTRGSHHHADAMSAKPPAKTVGWSNVNGFDSWMVKNGLYPSLNDANFYQIKMESDLLH